MDINSLYKTTYSSNFTIYSFINNLYTIYIIFLCIKHKIYSNEYFYSPKILICIFSKPKLYWPNKKEVFFSTSFFPYSLINIHQPSQNHPKRFLKSAFWSGGGCRGERPTNTFNLENISLVVGGVQWRSVNGADRSSISFPLAA